MTEVDRTNHYRLIISLIGLLLAIIIFVAVWFIGYFLFNAFDSIRGLGNDKLQGIFREIVTPGVGGYAALSVATNYLKKANPRFVFFGFSALILVFIGIYIGIVVPVAGKAGVGIWEFLLSMVSIVASILGAYFACKDKLLTSF